MSLLGFPTILEGLRLHSFEERAHQTLGNTEDSTDQV